MPLLFDLADTEDAPVVVTRSTWREVPQARFLSWSPARQLAYCVARDEDAAKHDAEWAEFYAARAVAYKEMQRAEGMTR